METSPWFEDPSDSPFASPFGDDLLPPLEAYADDLSQAKASNEGGRMTDEESEAAFQAREAERVKARDALYAQLNEQQSEAVNYGSKSLLVLAGAGSGKTSVLTARIAKLISTGRVPAKAVLAVTFTNKASQEMQHRLRKLLDARSVREMWMGTFHSLCSKMLRENAEAAGLPKTFAILDVDGQEAMARGILKDFGLTKASLKESAKARANAAASRDLLTPADILLSAGGIQENDLEDDGDANEFVTPGQCAKFISARKEAGVPPAPPAVVNTKSMAVDQMEAVYAEYQKRCAAAGLLDFQDLLDRGVRLLRDVPDIRQKYQDKFEAILVDEFQDTNKIQYEFLQLLKSRKSHVMAVGDDSQSIYAFRGADPRKMFQFVQEMTTDAEAPEGRIVKLEQNYRSLPHILEAANAIIARNPKQLKKTLFTSRPDGNEKIDLITFGNGMFEASSIARSIHHMVKVLKVPPSEVAVLYRTNQQSRLLEQELNKLGVPLTVYGGFRFYERQEIKVVMAYLDLICDMTRDLSFARVANVPPRGIGERTIEELRQRAKAKGISMMEMVGEQSVFLESNPKAFGGASAIKKQRLLEGFSDVVLNLADMAAEVPLSKLIERLVEASGLDVHYKSESAGSKAGEAEAEERLKNIAELVSAARQFEVENPQLTSAADQLPDYLAYVALMTSTSEADMSKKPTISLMTVHSSKGLEFDHVFIAGLEEMTFPHSRAIAEDEENGNGKSLEEAFEDIDNVDAEDLDADFQDGDGLQEERRLMYVAVTRARKTLTISHAQERMLNGETKAFEPSRFLQEIPANRLRLINDAEQFAKASRAGRDTGNREYGGDAFDDGRSEYRPKAPARSSAPVAPAAARSQTAPATRRMAIIGTAGRDKAHEMDRALWDAMLSDARSRVLPTDTLVSGGAAWADHLAVRLFLDGAVQHLELHFPAPLEGGAFAGPARDSAGSAANYYHSMFQKATGIDGLREIEQAIAAGASTTAQPTGAGYSAMFSRNRIVAATADKLVAYTFGEGDEPASSGTKNTWDRAAHASREHVRLGDLRLHQPSPTAPLPSPEPAPPAAEAMDKVKPWLRRGNRPVATEPTGAPAPSRPATESAGPPSAQIQQRIALMGRRPATRH
ncbi:hypothetical protein CBP36_19575 (plasmid) [Acidovorax carolinensis]|uniref:DNA 3'-5' helicase n=1 Tax=Acidovorax carolinensis TaxID=553814 RepID=A0A240UJG8_9BURK|nr:UvrD-helicase domain-containing protein [Acidovorax carolinensis]ART57108.1 hypothetical protein CBP35_19530 [Acidovorax carolinensis]ART61169.1 hypothetical protein CBP36_19575 [Acidovorax carolinensis]